MNPRDVNRINAKTTRDSESAGFGQPHAVAVAQANPRRIRVDLSQTEPSSESIHLDLSLLSGWDAGHRDDLATVLGQIGKIIP